MSEKSFDAFVKFELLEQKLLVFFVTKSWDIQKLVFVRILHEKFPILNIYFLKVEILITFDIFMSQNDDLITKVILL